MLFRVMRGVKFFNAMIIMIYAELTLTKMLYDGTSNADATMNQKTA